MSADLPPSESHAASDRSTSRGPRHSSIPDHVLLRRIGRGSYGEVWLARNVVEAYRAVKIVWRRELPEECPLDREFEGIKNFEPISRSHPGIVSILHVGRHDDQGCFFYVMEPADDMAMGQVIDPERYVPRTLHGELRRRGRFAMEACLDIGLKLSSALAFLHRERLVHRDIKPSNIIFQGGEPRLADAGLVAAMDQKVTRVGTAAYLPPEGPGRPTADIYSLGKVLYEVATGMSIERFPELPVQLLVEEESSGFMRLNEVIMKACEQEAKKRYQSAEEMHEALGRLLPEPPPSDASSSETSVRRTGSALARKTAAPQQGMLVTLLYRGTPPPDGGLVEVLEAGLTEAGFSVFYDRHLAIGVDWAREIEEKIRQSGAVVVLLSAEAAQSEMVSYEIELAAQAQQRQGRPMILPVRVQFTGTLTGVLASLLDPLHFFLWQSPEDDGRLVEELIRSLGTTQKFADRSAPSGGETQGGAVPLNSRYYLLRDTDLEFTRALARRDSIILLKGARQMGKTSLLARGLHQARADGLRVAFTDLQKFNGSHFASLEDFYKSLADLLADQFELPVLANDWWDARRGANTNFERFLRREVLAGMSGHLVWGLDEVDRLFTCDFGGEVFGLFRAWHNERALDPSGPWSHLTLAIAYATEAHLFIRDLNQSPFNVGTRLTLHDFTIEQVAELNVKHASPLSDPEGLKRFFEMVGGQPYLVRRGLAEMAFNGLAFEELEARASRDDGVFGDHLRRILVLLVKDPELAEVVRAMLRGQPCASGMSFYRLRSAGVISGSTSQSARLRCLIYQRYLEDHLT